MTLLELARHRRAVRAYEDTLRTSSAIAAAGADLRREANTYLRAGRPDLAAPYIAEAELFESASAHAAGL